MQTLIHINDIESSHRLKQFIGQNICEVKIYTEAAAMNVKENIRTKITERHSSVLIAYREVFI